VGEDGLLLPATLYSSAFVGTYLSPQALESSRNAVASRAI